VRVIPGRGCVRGVVGAFWIGLPAGRRVRNRCDRRRACERPGVEGKTPVVEIVAARWESFPSSTGPEESRVNRAGPPAKPKYSLVTDSGEYREGMVKSTAGAE
jgi:hypothetical protein